MTGLDHIRVVLVEPQVAGNIGACARAMAAMGLAELWLVAPRAFPHPEATQRATEAAGLLERARCVDRLDQAIADCELVVATSARRRAHRWPTLDPAQTADRLCACVGPAALVFGPEPSGLTSDQVYQAHFQSSIALAEPANSLNLSHAVQVYAWELMRAAASPGPESEREHRATAQQLDHLYALLGQLLAECDPDAPSPAKRLRRLQGLLNRAHPSRDEWLLLEGLIQRVVRRLDGAGP